MIKAVSLLRVSTDGQEEKYGIEAQRFDVDMKFVQQRGYEIVKEFVEVESGGKYNRAVLDAAAEWCRRHRTTLLVAEVDRLSRRLVIIATLLKSPIDFRVATYPDMDPKENKVFFQILGLVAEITLDRIRASTKAGLAVAKAKGVVLGENGKVLAKQNRTAANEFALKMDPIITRLKETGITSCRKIAKALNYSTPLKSDQRAS
jgi:DNA invertase Pin-like site-specific DNA recombinase